MDNSQPAYKFPCPCCGHLVFEKPGDSLSCPVCAWEDSEEQLKDPFLPGAPNKPTLWQAQRNYMRLGISDESRLNVCSQTQNMYARDPEWRPVIEKIDDFGSPEHRATLVKADYKTLYYWKSSFWNYEAPACKQQPTPDVERAHKLSLYNRNQIQSNKSCGCFYCQAIFKPDEINEWIDQELTAICPRCGIDSVLASDSGYPINSEFLNSMKKRWFH
ncbi:MAG: hypothetical protein JSS83_27590 [Cyanobacteria bacterium SZAS LIN-3]|nr:hypothetical protein [Cyanobacteria bacterium SZAS LIN-3]